MSLADGDARWYRRCMFLVVATALASLTFVHDHGTNPGNLDMYEHVPASAAPMPLVLVLHGCAQDHQYAVDAGFTALADQYGTALVVAETNTSNNQDACFNWFDPFNTDRDSGEALSLKEMIDAMRTRHDIDDARVFVAGASAGGAMAVAMLAAYPDVFAAGAVYAAVPYGCATDVFGAFDCMNGPVDGTQAQWAQLVLDASSATSFPRIAIWAGTADQTVNPVNADELVLQWTGVHALSTTPTAQDALGPATRAIYGDAGGLPIVESVRVPGMDHGTAVDPPCGTAGDFLVDANVCAADATFTFFGIAAHDGGEGEGAAGEGEGAASEGEGSASEGEGSASEGEGEGAASEGEGAASEGEGAGGEGEGAHVDHGAHPGDEVASCASTGSVSTGLASSWAIVLGAIALARGRRRRVL